MDSAKSPGKPAPGAPAARRTPTARPRLPGVPAIVARVREDARIDPGRYLEESEVPGGGE